MNISGLQIHNFRSICDLTVLLSDYTLFVGANNAGKSNVVDALRCFLGTYAYDRDTDFPRTKGMKIKDELTWVDVEFDGVGQANVGEELSVAVRDGMLRVRRTLEVVDGKLKSWYCAVDGDGRAVKGTKSVKTLPKGLSLAVSYLPSMSKPSDDLKMSGASLLKDLIGDSIRAAFEKLGAVGQLQKTVRRLVVGSKNSDKGESALSKFESKVAHEISNWGASFVLGTKDLDVADVIKNLLEVRIGDIQTHGETEIDRFGSGFQRNLIFSIIKSAAEIQMVGASESRRILIFEEPEAFLHPDQQEELARSLRELAKRGIQIVCTSHSPCFVGRKMDDVTSIVRVVKNKGVTVSRQITGDAWKEIIKAGGNFPKYLMPYIKGTTAYLDSFRYAFWFAGQRASVCFARQVLLVEGATEAALFARLQDDGRLHLPTGTVVVDCMGKFNLHRFMAVMHGWGIPFAVVHDDDSGKTGKKLKEHSVWNRFVDHNARKSKAKVLALKGDLEITLGVEKPNNNRDDVKPYHLLNEYEKGRCKGVDKLCRDIENLFKGLKVKRGNEEEIESV